MRIINKIKLFIKGDTESIKVANLFKEKLLDNNYVIDDIEFDLAISIGGDGTFLKMVSECNFNTKLFYIGINSGSLGFLQDVNISDIDYFIELLNINKLNYEEISFGSILVNNGNNELPFFNEAVIRNTGYKTLRIPVYIDNSYLENFVGDGLLVSTAVGSTAYNLSSGGPIIYNSLDVFTLTPLSPINNIKYSSLSRPIVLPKNKKVNVISDHELSLSIVIDGKEKIIDKVKKIEVTLSKNKIKCLRMNDYDFIKKVSEKLV